jgi:hypothetical protein
MRTIFILTALLAVAAVASGAAPAKAKYVEFDNVKTAVTVKVPTCLHDTPSDKDESVMCFAVEGAELTIIGKINKKVKVDGESGYWYKVDMGDGEDYYVFSTYIEFAKSNTSK